MSDSRQIIGEINEEGSIKYLQAAIKYSLKSWQILCCLPLGHCALETAEETRCLTSSSTTCSAI